MAVAYDCEPTLSDTQIHHLKKCKTSLEPAVKAGYDDL